MNSPNNSTPTRRKIKLINREFQFKLIAKFILINFLVMVIFGVLVYIFFKSEITASLASAHATYKSVSQMLFPIVLILSILNIIIISIFIAIMVLYSSHKIAGPMFRFNEAIKEMTAKNLQPLTKIRVKDQLQEFSESLTLLKETYAKDFQTLKDKINEIKDKLKDLEKTPMNQEIRGDIEEIEEIIAQYKL